MPFSEEYQRLMLIGRGSFATVYKVRHKKLGYIRAIKISNELVSDENDKAYQSFLNECRLLLQISNGCHPNIVHIYQPRLINDRALVEMDFVDGVTLTDYVKEHRFIPMSEFRQFASGIVGAVGYCHADLYRFLMNPDEDDLETDPDDGSRFLISPEKEKELQKRYCVNHNDLHSNNIMRRHYDGNYVLLDFGLAIQAQHCIKSSSRADGAYEYSSPEKLDGGEITAASDVYSLGVLMYEMLTGSVPFVMGTSGSMAEISRIYDRQLHEIPASPGPLRQAAFETMNPGKNYVKDYPEELEAIIMKCLEKRPEDRYQNAKELHKALMDVFSMTVETHDDESKNVIKAMQASIDSLKKENESLRRRLAECSGSEPLRPPLYKAGDMIESMIVCHVDRSGEHGLLIVTRSDSPERWCRKVDEEDFELFSLESQQWYSENCFIIPRGTHLPTRSEIALIRKSLPITPELPDRLIWCGDSENGQAFAIDLSTGEEFSAPRQHASFWAIKVF